jgi:L-ribulose-5-phosphate 3-epimerase
MNIYYHRIGFMQGRLSAQVDGKIQAFPAQFWRDEFAAAAKLKLHLMEWTLDQDKLYDNPLMTEAGRKEILALSAKHDLHVSSLTGDCFMQAPFWKAEGQARQELQTTFLDVCDAASRVGATFIVVPLVDTGRLDDREQEDLLVDFLTEHAAYFSDRRLKVVFECDFEPADLARFIDRLDPGVFGINYDIGNSAGIGYDPVEEFAAYGARVLNVHVKDRMLRGTTVPLGTGNADFECVFGLLARQGYQGNVIMQTARAREGEHDIVLARYRDLVMGWMTDAFAVCNQGA